MKIKAGRITGVLLALCLLLDTMPAAAVEKLLPIPVEVSTEENLFHAPLEPEAGEKPFFLTPETDESLFPPLEETGKMRTSEAGIAFIKEFEDFTPKVIADVGQWVIGYGCRCDPGDYPEEITEAEADRLMREALSLMEDKLNSYITECGVSLTQAQFDALSSMTYNMGAAWIGQDYRIWNMIRAGTWNYSDNEIASAIGVFCHIGTQFSGSLAKRRAREAQLFLYGDYTGLESRPVHYVSFEEESGELDTDVLFYTAGSKFRTLPTISCEGVHFDGWYTSDGIRLDIGDTVGQNLEVTACWSETPVTQTVDTPDFSDVKNDDWFAFYVQELHAANIISGYADNSFHPHATVTNGEALKLVLLACGFSSQPSLSGHWADGYRALALEHGFLREEDLNAGLDAPASRAMIAALTAGALGLKRRDSSISPFADTDAEGPVALFQAGIIEGSVDSEGVRSFYPDQPVSRAETAKIVWNIYHPSARF